MHTIKNTQCKHKNTQILTPSHSRFDKQILKMPVYLHIKYVGFIATEIWLLFVVADKKFLLHYVHLIPTSLKYSFFIHKRTP